MNSLPRALRRTMLRLGAASLTDAQLLQRFVASADQAAFGQLVERHGPMVLRVCQRVLRHAQDAEDAFQATFIVLARKASTVVKQESLSGWLYSVAFRIALKAKAQATERNAGRCAGAEAALIDDRHVPDGEAARDLRPVLDAELSRLPEKYRTALVLCYLQGKSQSEAAQLLHCAPEALKKRLFRARDLLRGRLARRGMTVTPAALGAALAAQATAAAALPGPMLLATVHTALSSSAGAQAPAHALAAAVLGDLGRRRLARWLLLVAVVLMGGGVVSVGLWSRAHQKDVRTRERDGLVARAPEGPRLAYFHSHDNSPGIQSVTVQVWNPSSYNHCSVYTNPPTGPNGGLYPNGRFFSIGVAPVKFTPPDAAGNFAVSMTGTFCKGEAPGVPALAILEVAANGDPDPTRRFSGTVKVFAFSDGKVGEPLLSDIALGWN